MVTTGRVTVPWCHVGDVGYSYLLKTVPEDGGWAMDAHVKGSCISNELAKIFSNELAVILSREWPPEKLRIELFNGSYEYIAGKSIVFRPQPNTSATGQPTISGTAQVGETLTADTAGIADADGLDDATFSYQWIANDGTSDADISGATGPTYALTNTEEDKAIKVKVSTFTDDAGNEESLTSVATAAVVVADANTAATGAPTISGTAQVGETLRVDTSGIADTDGLTNVSFSYQWIRSDGTADLEDTGAPFHQTVPTYGTADLDIDGATTATYTVTVTDVNHAIKVRVSYTDDSDNVESLTSSATVDVPIEVALTFSVEGTTVTCDSYNVQIVNLPIEECDDPTSTEQGASGEIDVELEIARSVSSQSYKFSFHIYEEADSLGHLSITEANDLCLGPGLAESTLIDVTPDDGTGPFTYTDEGTIFELCPRGRINWSCSGTGTTTRTKSTSMLGRLEDTSSSLRMMK